MIAAKHTFFCQEDTNSFKFDDEETLKKIMFFFVVASSAKSII